MEHTRSAILKAIPVVGDSVRPFQHQSALPVIFSTDFDMPTLLHPAWHM